MVPQTHRFDPQLRWLLLFAVAALSVACGSRDGEIETPSSPVATVQPQPTPETTPASVIARLADRAPDEAQPPIEIDGWRIEVVKTMKSEPGSDPSEIEDAILTRNGQPVKRFEGVFYPLGNKISFEEAPLTGEAAARTLVIVDSSYRYVRTWIVSFRPKRAPLVIFDSNDYDVTDSAAVVRDVDGDGTMELVALKFVDFGLGLARSDMGLPAVVFRFDRASGLYVPAGASLPLPPPDRPVQTIAPDTAPDMRKFLTHFCELVFAGREGEAWEFFDAEWRPELHWKFAEMGKQKTRRTIADALLKIRIYRLLMKRG